MANDPKIDIRISTTADTAGATQAEKAVEGVADATQAAADAERDLNKARQEGRGFGGMLDGTTPRTDEQAAANERQKKSVEELTTATDDLRESEEKLEEVSEQSAQAADVRMIKKVALAQALNLAAGAAAEMGEKIRGASRDLQDLDPASAAKLDNVASGFDAVSHSARGAAAGMVLLGPPGAVIGAVVAPALGALGKEIEGAYQAFLNLKEIEQIAADLPAKMLAVKRATMVREQVESWKALVDEMGKAAAEADSFDRIDSALRRSNERFAENQLRTAEAGGDESQIESAQAALNLLREQNAQAEQSAATAAAQRAVEIALREFEGATKAMVLAYDPEGSKESIAEQERLGVEIKRYREALEVAERRLRETQAIGGIEGETRQDIRQTDAAIEIVRVGQDVTQAARDAIEQIKNNASSEGRAPLAQESETISRIEALAAQDNPSAERLLGILQSLGNTLTAKDENLQTAVEGMIRNVDAVVTRYDAMTSRISDLEERINQTQ
jgi:hypothetical protein